MDVNTARKTKPPAGAGCLGEVARALTMINLGTSFPEDLLKTIAEAVDARAVRLIRQFFSEKDAPVFQIVAAVSRDVRRFPVSSSEDIESLSDLPGDGGWEKMLRGDVVFLKPFSSSQLEARRNLLVVPLFLDEHLYGFLAVSDLPGEAYSQDLHVFFTALRHIIELWTVKANTEKMLTDLINYIPDPTYFVDKKGEVKLWNKATEKMTGWSAERMVGKGNYENAIPFYGKRRVTVPVLIFHPDPLWEANYLEFRRVEEDVFSKAYCPALPGGGAFVTSKTSILHDINNRPWGCVHNVRDVTRERQMEIDLHRSKYIFEAITDYAGIGTALFQGEKIIYFNEAFRQMFDLGHSAIELNEFFGIVSGVHPEDRLATSNNFKKVVNSLEGPFKFQFRYQKGGKLFYYRCYAQIDTYEDIPIVHFIVDDVTRQVELSHKARLDELRMYHEDRLSALGVMATGIAHELNQPLNTIKVTSDSLLFGRDQGWHLDEAEIFESLQLISDQVSRMSNVIENVRSFARGGAQESVGVVSLNDAIHNVFAMIGRQLEVHGIKVYKDLAPSLPPLKTNLSRLEQVIMNLIVNARQALDESPHIRKEIWIRSYTTNRDLLHLEVEDTATGISEDIRGRIFDPFFTTKEVGKGTGLGLSICSSIISSLNGSIDVTNNEKGGATFSVIIPTTEGYHEHPSC